MTVSGGSSVWADPESARAHLREQVEQAQKRAEAAQKAASQVQGLKVSAFSPDRSVEVTVDPSGALLDLKLTDDAVELEPRELASTILHTAAQARHQASAQAVEVMAGVFGEDSSAVNAMREEIKSREAARTEPGFGY